MNELILTTYDWVPETPRGYVRDLRVRWALEEANLPYKVISTPFKDRDATHFEHHPFGQTPWLTDGELTVFESGAILLHIGEISEALLPINPQQRSQVIQWVFAALNSVEMPAVPWSIYQFMDDQEETPGRQGLNQFLDSRLQHMESVLGDREWLVDNFSIADILMSDVLRLVDRFDGLSSYSACRNYVARAVARPCFSKAYNDQLAHFAAAD